MKKIIATLMLIPVSCFGMYQQLNESTVTNYDTIVGIDPHITPSRSAQSLEAKTLAAVRNKYPYSFIRNTFTLMQQGRTETLKQIMPEIKQLLDSQERVYNMDDVYYALNAAYLVLTTAVLTYAGTRDYQDQHPLWLVTGFIYLGIRVFFMVHKLQSLPERKKILENHYNFLLKCIDQKEALTDLATKVESSLEYRFDQENKKYEKVLKKAKIHTKLLTLDGGPSLDELCKEFETEFSSISQALAQEDCKEVMLDSWVGESQKLIEAIKKRDLDALQTILGSWMDVNPQMANSVLTDPQSLINAAGCRLRTSRIPEYLLKTFIGLAFWIESSFYVSVPRTIDAPLWVYLGLITPISALLGVSEGLSILYSTGDTMDSNPELTTLKWHQKFAQNTMTIAKLKKQYLSTIDYQKQQSSDMTWLSKEEDLNNKLDSLKTKRYALKNRIKPPKSIIPIGMAASIKELPDPSAQT